MLKNTIKDAKKLIDEQLIKSGKCLKQKSVQEAINLLRGVVTIVYPMQLPPYDVIRMEFSSTEDLKGTEASREVIELYKSLLGFTRRQILPNKNLKEFSGVNDKIKVVGKISKHGEGPPGRESVVNENMRRQMMAHAYKR